MTRLLGLSVALVLGSVAFACAPPSEDAPAGDEQEISSSKVDDHWFYSGPLPTLENPSVVASMKGHTAHVRGTLPRGATLPSDLPHVKTHGEGGRTIVDIVYPIATASPSNSNSRPGTYRFQLMKPYRPNGPAWTHSQGWHDVTWGGFPFIAYNGGIAFHGPITDTGSETVASAEAWYLQRGRVSGGCNRMLGENIVELTHVLGTSMRKIYKPNTEYSPPSPSPSVKVISDYDTFGGKYIDVDYPTASGATRPASVHGSSNVEMFGSWVTQETPDGRDLPASMQWEGGESGNWYEFSEHVRRDWVCSMPKSSLEGLKAIAERNGGELPKNFCAIKNACDRRVGRVCKASELGI